MASQTKGAEDMLAFGKQFWDTWTSFAQGSAPGQTPSWGAPADAFAQAAAGLPNEARQAVEALSEHGRQFFQFMQQAAAQMGAGDALAAGDIASLWRRGMADGNPALDALRAASSEGARGFEQMGKDLQSLLGPFKQEWNNLLGQPAFGYSREKQEALQALSRAATAHAEANQAYNALLLKASQRGMEYFENKLAERSEPGRQIDSARALYDLWIDAAEEAYAEIALSPDFRTAYGNLVNTQMRLRQSLNKQVEQQAAELGLPTRSELDGTHQKIKSLQRETRELRQRLADLEGARDGAARPAPSPATARPSAPKPESAPAKPSPIARAAKASQPGKVKTAAKRVAKPAVVDLTDVAAPAPAASARPSKKRS